ncbi:hypothetical protein Btru_068234 [Bulinus truncatus]|nr:hypothetical protein Btru_068234 [Bulinus truncatus]
MQSTCNGHSSVGQATEKLNKKKRKRVVDTVRSLKSDLTKGSSHLTTVRPVKRDLTTSTYLKKIMVTNGHDVSPSSKSFNSILVSDVGQYGGTTFFSPAASNMMPLHRSEPHSKDTVADADARRKSFSQSSNGYEVCTTAEKIDYKPNKNELFTAYSMPYVDRCPESQMIKIEPSLCGEMNASASDASSESPSCLFSNRVAESKQTEDKPIHNLFNFLKPGSREQEDQSSKCAPSAMMTTQSLTSVNSDFMYSNTSPNSDRSTFPVSDLNFKKHGNSFHTVAHNNEKIVFDGDMSEDLTGKPNCSSSIQNTPSDEDINATQLNTIQPQEFPLQNPTLSLFQNDALSTSESILITSFCSPSVGNLPSPSSSTDGSSSHSPDRERKQSTGALYAHSKSSNSSQQAHGDGHQWSEASSTHCKSECLYSRSYHRPRGSTGAEHDVKAPTLGMLMSHDDDYDGYGTLLPQDYSLDEETGKRKGREVVVPAGKVVGGLDGFQDDVINIYNDTDVDDRDYDSVTGVDDSVTDVDDRDYDSVTGVDDSVTDVDERDYDSVTGVDDSVIDVDDRDYDSVTDVDDRDYDSVTDVDDRDYDSVTDVDDRDYGSVTDVDDRYYDSVTDVDDRDYDSVTDVDDRDYDSVTDVDDRDYDSVTGVDDSVTDVDDRDYDSVTGVDDSVTDVDERDYDSVTGVDDSVIDVDDRDYDSVTDVDDRDYDSVTDVDDRDYDSEYID